MYARTCVYFLIVPVCMGLCSLRWPPEMAPGMAPEMAPGMAPGIAPGMALLVGSARQQVDMNATHIPRVGPGWQPQGTVWTVV